MKLALVQMRCHKGALEENRACTKRHIEQAERAGVDVIAFPEMSLSGYGNPELYPQAVISCSHPAVTDITRATARTGITALIGVQERNPAGKPFITQLVIQDGSLAGSYRKVNVAEEEREFFALGSDTPLFDHAGVPFGVAVCADIGHRSLFERYARAGARVVLECAAPGLYGEQRTRNWRSSYDWWREECARQLGRYASEFSLWIGVATQAGRSGEEDFPGGGYLFGPDGELHATTADWSEQVLYAELAVH